MRRGRLIPPDDYRTWVFLSSGVDMSYSQRPAMADAHMFDNVFAPRAAYAAFQRTGVWPDKTVLMLENRGAGSKGSINRQGLFQTGEVMGLEAHVKDTARFKGGWAFFSIDGDAPAKQIPYAADCYACHQAHGAADTTFVQFYPTLLPVADAARDAEPRLRSRKPSRGDSGPCTEETSSSTAAAASALSLAPGLPVAASAPVFRRVRPGDPGWPDAASWRRLNAAVGGELIEGRPLFTPLRTPPATPRRAPVLQGRARAIPSSSATSRRGPRCRAGSTPGRLRPAPM